jgi:non-ribosomal peptide synthase protein (TIGR01720 family)
MEEKMTAEDIDTSRTVGWFTSLYPVLLNIDGKQGHADLIKSVKEQLRKVPDKGMAYGVLKYINKELSLSATPGWDIVFNYLGQLGNVVSDSRWISAAAEPSGQSIGDEHSTTDKFSVNSLVIGGELIINWAYSSLHYEEVTAKQLSEKYLSNLSLLIDHCMRQGRSSVIHTPSDYGLGNEISYQDSAALWKNRLVIMQGAQELDGLYRLSRLGGCSSMDYTKRQGGSYVGEIQHQ